MSSDSDADEDNDFGTWWLIDLSDERVMNTFHHRTKAEQKRDDLIDYWEEHTEDDLVVKGVPWAYDGPRAEDYIDTKYLSDGTDSLR